MSQHLSTTYRRQITWNGYPADVMKSGLQKYIRRGMIEKALYCAGELDLFKEAPDAAQGEGVRTNFLHRLMVIFMEDVENLSLWPDMTQKMKELFAEREKANRDKAKEERLLSEVVVQMGASTKARMCSHIRAVFNPKYKPIHGSYPSIQPLWAEIEQNEKEKKLDTLEHNCKLYSKYVKEKNILAVYYGFQIEHSEEKLKEKILKSSKPVWYLFQQLLNPMDPKQSAMVNKFIEWNKEHMGTLNESFMCWLIPLLHHLGVISQGELPNVDFAAYPMNWDQNRAGAKIEVDEFVLDKHTAKGRGKGLVEFALHGSLVENPAPFVNPLWKQFYEDGKRMEDGVPILGEKALAQAPLAQAQVPSAVPLVPAVAAVSNAVKRKKPIAGPVDVEGDEKTEHESRAYDFVVRTQLTTMGTKMDVYLAKDKAGSMVVVKGPYQTRKEIDILVSNTEWKKKHNLPYNRFVVRELIPDRWPEGVPLGARNKIDRNRPAFFLVFESYFGESELRTKMHSSTLWPSTEVVDWDKIPFHFDYKKRALSDQEITDYVHAILFRYLLGISDYADRNFVMKDGRVISIDEDVENHEINLYKVLQKNKADFVYRWLLSNYDKLDVQRWTPKNPNDVSQQERLKEIQTKELCLRMFQDPANVPAQSVPEAPKVVPALPVPEAPKEVPSPASQPAAQPKESIKPEITSSIMNDHFVFIDNVYRSRMTLLDILEMRGYDVAKYRKFSPAEAKEALHSLTSLSFVASKKDDATQICDVRYVNITNPKLETYFKENVPDENSEKTEMIIMTEGPVTDRHHATALKQYLSMKEEPNENGERVRRKLRVSFFSIELLVINPLKHVLVPKHEIVPESEHKKLMESMYITAKSKFPEIKFHVDPIARCIGAIPGDIVKITRASASAGESIIYRVCAP
uniref:RNA polymerase subunit H/Rpb5 C-terminal domain-containing protein n=1 Tax=viral metagenome TaxID=1070528 RepID=A0A6C0DCY1_9ZZZZ